MEISLDRGHHYSSMFKKIVTFLLILIVVGIISACSGTEGNNAGYYLVDPRFSDLYERLAGSRNPRPPNIQ